MKYLILIIFLQAIFCFSKQNEIEFTPINVNFSGLKFNEDTLTVLGDYGVILKGNPDTENWKQIQIFESGRIVEIFEENSKRIAFNDKGSIAVSFDSGNNWEIVKNMDIELLAVISYPEGFFIRERNKLLTIDKNFELTGNEYELFTDLPPKFLTNLYFDKSIVYYDDKFVIGSKDETHLLLSQELNLLKELDFKEIIADTSFVPPYRIYTDSNYVYFRIDNFIYKTGNFSDYEKYNDNEIKGRKLTLLDGDFYSIYYSIYTSQLYYKYNIELYKITQDTTALILNATSEINTKTVLPDYFTIKSEKLYIAGQNKHLSEINLKDSTVKILSDYSGFALYGLQDKLKDSSYLFYSLNYLSELYSYIYKTDNDGVTFKPITYKNSDTNFAQFNFTLKHFNKTRNELFLGGPHSHYSSTQRGIFTSTDFGHSFDFKNVKTFDFKNNSYSIIRLNQNLPDIYNLPEFFKRGDNYVSYNHKLTFEHYSKIFIFDENLEIIDTFADSSMYLSYIYSKDSTKYLFFGVDIETKNYKVKYTEDKGVNWHNIKEYKDSIDLYLRKEININNKNYLFLFFEHLKDSTIFCDVVDLDTKEAFQILNKPKNIFFHKINLPYSVTSDSNYIYLAVKDTLYRITNLKDRESWEYFVFPKGGNVMRYMEKEENRFNMRYSDSLSEENIYWVKINNFIKPEAIIYATDNDFGQVQINEDFSKKANISIVNRSDNKNLIINSISLPKEDAFFTSLTNIEDLYPIEINPLDTFDFEVTFKPVNVREYIDSITYKSNAVQMDSITYLRGIGIDTLTSVIEDLSKEKDNYLFNYLPSPIPASTEVRTLLYWDNSISFDKENIKIFNINGVEVGREQDISLDIINSYSGNLIWNCTNVPDGVYLIRISHGNKKRTIKVMVKK